MLKMTKIFNLYLKKKKEKAEAQNFKLTFPKLPDFKWQTWDWSLSLIYLIFSMVSCFYLFIYLFYCSGFCHTLK